MVLETIRLFFSRIPADLLEKLNQTYPNASVRQVVRGQVKHIRDSNPKEIEAL
jgi:hypothetical protein